jgi:hypothetical protein
MPAAAAKKVPLNRATFQYGQYSQRGAASQGGGRMMGGDDDDGDAIAETQEISSENLFQRPSREQPPEACHICLCMAGDCDCYSHARTVLRQP